jgi:hypothetical protein
MRKQNNARIEHRNQKRRQSALKKMRRLCANHVRIREDIAKKFGPVRAKPSTMKMPSTQAMKRKGSKG